MKTPGQILQEVFGYNSFFSLQSEIIENVLAKKDSLVIMPTGGGKSICYQIPALIFKGLTIVLSPLKSLMKDQVAQLRLLGVEATLLNSSLTREEYKSNYALAFNGKVRLLYLAPESLGREDIVSLLKKNPLDCIAVDEAHCISEWGHDFRKDYRQLGDLREKFQSAACIALTATATPRVQDDIIASLKLKSCKKFLASFNRENLYLEVQHKYDALFQVIDFLNEHKGEPGIIYCLSRKQTEELSDELVSRGFSAKPYHAGMDDKERNRNQDLFRNDEITIIVATIAFGMGINKSNVRFVIHHDIPKNLESYYQEIGRSGRDGLRADCLLLYRYSDVNKIKYFIDQKEDPTERASAQIHLDAMINYAESYACRRKVLITYFGEKYETVFCGMCDSCRQKEKDFIDITVAAQKFLSAVKRTGEIYGAEYIIDVLTGSQKKQIILNKHDKLSVYKIGEEYDREQWELICRQLISLKLLNREQSFGSLKLGDDAYPVLKNHVKVRGYVKEITKAAVPVKKEWDNMLFSILKSKRKQIADAEKVPAFFIFTDKSLAEMALAIPTTESEFLSISGVGKRKYDLYGKQFIDTIRSYTESHKIPERIRFTRRPSPSQAARTGKIADQFNEGKSIAQIAEEYDFRPATIIRHLERYLERGNNLKTEKLKKAVQLSESRWQEVFGAFQVLGLNPVKPVYDKFNGDLSYNDLRVLRLIYLQQKKKS